MKIPSQTWVKIKLEDSWSLQTERFIILTIETRKNLFYIHVQ